MSLKENDLDYLLTLMPIAGGWATTWLIGKISDEHISKGWLFPESWVNATLWSLIYIILGFLIFKAKTTDDKEVLWGLTTICMASYLWQYVYTVQQDLEKSVNVLYLILIICLYVFIELMFSNMIDEDSVESLGKNYIHLFSLVIVWIIYLINIYSMSKPINGYRAKVTTPIYVRSSPLPQPTPLPQSTPLPNYSPMIN